MSFLKGNRCHTMSTSLNTAKNKLVASNKKFAPHGSSRMREIWTCLSSESAVTAKLDEIELRKCEKYAIYLHNAANSSADENLRFILNEYKQTQLLIAREYLSLKDYTRAINCLDMIGIVCGFDEFLLRIIAEIEALTGYEIKVPEIANHPSKSINIHHSPSVRILDRPSLETFLYFSEEPILLQNVISDWPCLNAWKNTDYIEKLAGHRLVPVEIGRNYFDPSWRQNIMTLSNFLETYVRQSRTSASSENGYIAQYDLLSACPKLAKDVTELEYCFAIAEDVIVRNIWIGSNSHTPLHFDNKTNFFCQIVGVKEVFLAPPFSFSVRNDLKNNANTSLIDNVNKALYVAVGPGDILYIPKLWFHELRSNGFSISLSHWC